MRSFIPVAVVASVVLSGCASTSATRLTSVSVGMTKAQVVSILGNPESVSGNGRQEVLYYTLGNSFFNSEWNSTYAVQFVDGRVVGYGRQ